MSLYNRLTNYLKKNKLSEGNTNEYKNSIKNKSLQIPFILLVKKL